MLVGISKRLLIYKISFLRYTEFYMHFIVIEASQLSCQTYRQKYFSQCMPFDLKYYIGPRASNVA